LIRTQRTGGVGVDRSSTNDLWLRSYAHVVLHPAGTQTGMFLCLGQPSPAAALFPINLKTLPAIGAPGCIRTTTIHL